MLKNLVWQNVYFFWNFETCSQVWMIAITQDNLFLLWCLHVHWLISLCSKCKENIINILNFFSFFTQWGIDVKVLVYLPKSIWPKLLTMIPHFFSGKRCFLIKIPPMCSSTALNLRSSSLLIVNRTHVLSPFLSMRLYWEVICQKIFLIMFRMDYLSPNLHSLSTGLPCQALMK